MTQRRDDDETFDPAAQDPEEANEEQQGRDIGSGGAGGDNPERETGGNPERDLPTSDEGQPYQPDPLGNPGGPEREEHT